MKLGVELVTGLDVRLVVALDIMLDDETIILEVSAVDWIVGAREKRSSLAQHSSSVISPQHQLPSIEQGVRCEFVSSA